MAPMKRYRQRPKLVDLCCGEGGASLGYYGAGFDVIGVDIEPQPRYPFDFIEADVLTEEVWDLVAQCDIAAASPPCQSYSRNVKHLSKPKPKIIAHLRRLLVDSGKLFIIENVPGAPLRSPVELCGHYFGLRVKRHRLFECNFTVPQPPCACAWEDKPVIHARGTNAIKRLKEEFPDQGPDKVFADAMGVRWMTRTGSREAIPPDYTRYLGQYALRALRES